MNIFIELLHSGVAVVDHTARLHRIGLCSSGGGGTSNGSDDDGTVCETIARRGI